MPATERQNHFMTAKLAPAIWAGRAIATLVVVVMLIDAAVSLLAPHLLAKSMEETGFPVALSSTIGIILVICTVLYAIPRTSILGAVLLTGFFGGAICTHLRVGELGSAPQIVCVVLGVATWTALYLRYGSVREGLPFTKPSGAEG